MGKPDLIDLLENHRLVAVDEDAVGEVEADRPGEHHGLQVPPGLGEVANSVAVRHPRRVLVDDRALVELGGRVMRRGPDQLHAPGVGLAVGLPAREGR